MQLDTVFIQLRRQVRRVFTDKYYRVDKAITSHNEHINCKKHHILFYSLTDIVITNGMAFVSFEYVEYFRRYKLFKF